MSLFDRLFRRSAPTDSPWVTYRSPAGFFSLQHPAAWSVTVKDNIVNICPPDQTGAITVSAFHGTPPVPNFAQKWLADTFEKEDALSELEEVANNGWTGFRQGFASAGSEPRAWVAIVATLEPVFVLITANDTPGRFRERGEVYGRVLESLHLFRPGGDSGGVS